MKTWKQRTFSLVAILALFAVVFMGCPTPNEGNKNQTPIAEDFNISGTGTFTYDGNPKTVTVTAKEGKSSGTITVKYDGSATAPSAVGAYTVTFDVAAATGWNEASGLNAGTLTINYILIADINNLSGYLSSKPANTKDTPYYIVLNIDNEDDFASLRTTLDAEPDKYVYLDLSGSTITTIPDYAFNDDFTGKGCITLTGITIPNNVTSIGIYAFFDCASLTSITIPNNIIRIGGAAFSDCTGLISVTISNRVVSIEGTTFLGCTSLISVIIPNSVKSIGGIAFASCTSLASVTIPNSVESIGVNAFSNCTSLANVTFQGPIASDNFSVITPFLGDLRAKFYATDPTNGTPGTYITTTPVGSSSVWEKQ